MPKHIAESLQEKPLFIKNSQHKQNTTWHNTALLVEALVILAVIAACIAVFVQLFSYAYLTNYQDAQRAHAITLATNEAETFAANPAGTTSQTTTDAEGYSITRTITPQNAGHGTLYSEQIVVSYGEKVLYELATSSYVSQSESAVR